MSSFPSTVSLSNVNTTESLSRLSGATEKLRKLQLSKKEATTVSSSSIQRDFAPVQTFSIVSNDLSLPEYEEITVTIRKSERGFGFDLKNGILISKVFPNTPAHHSGIQVGDIILKINGTCVKSKESKEIHNMIDECANSFMSLHLQRRLPFTNATPSPCTPASSSMYSVRSRLEESKSELSLNESKNSADSRTSDDSKTELDEQSRSDSDTDHEDSAEMPVVGTLAQSADSNLTQFVNDSTELGRNLVATHRKQHSMSDESIKNLNIYTNDTESSSSSQKRPIKKTRSSTNGKGYQTQSLSNIAINSLNHSVSAGNLIKPKINDQNDDIIDCKDDVAYTSEDNLHDANDKFSFDMNGCNDYKNLILKPISLSIFLRYTLDFQNESPNDLYFCLFVDDLLASNEKKDTFIRWSYELYTVFLDHSAPLRIRIKENIIRKFEEIFEQNSSENIILMKRLLEESRKQAIQNVNSQLARFKEIDQIGLASLFHGNDWSKMSISIDKNDFDSNRSCMVAILDKYPEELGKNLVKINNEWNGPKDTALISALASSLATFIKRFGLPVKQIGKYEIDKIPIFFNKKLKLKKNSTYSVRGHSLIDSVFFLKKSLCCRCNQPFWGIGYQGLTCQKSKCDIKIHRHCLNNGQLSECQGSQKTIKSDYKEKFDNIQKMIFRPKKKDEEPQNTFAQNLIVENQSNAGDSSSNIPTNYPSDYIQRNLPVNEAIKKFEMLNAPKPSPSILTSPPATKVATLHSGSSSPNNNEQRNSSHNNSPDHLNNLKKDTNHPNQSQILPNKPYGNTTCLNQSYSSASNGYAREQACKRVGSLKVDVKKSKSNVARSKSDPEPIEIKNAISSTNPYSSRLNDRFCVDTPSGMNEHEPNTNSYRSSFTGHHNSVNDRFWMQESDIEVDEELPSICASIPKEILEKLTRKEIKTQEVINELIHTEQKHVRNLKIMKNHFYIPIQVNVYLTVEEQETVFPNLDEVLEIHSNFNKKLKELRRENPIVPIKQLIDVILEQFKGEEGAKFQSACAKFCENQSQAIKLLQTKLKNSDKFNQFISGAENHWICRKLHLKDFLPTEVQRLVKYKLLFNELSKSASNQDDINRLQECVEASSKISHYVNNAVTVCENKIRNDEIASRIDTREFDQYAVKNQRLAPYRNLNVKDRKLLYEGELEWKHLKNGSKILHALLYEDILVLLEKSADEKRRYILKQLNYIENRLKKILTPVIPIVWITRFGLLSDKRQFYLVVEQDGASDKNSMENKKLLTFVTKSGDERSKWCNYLEHLTVKNDESSVLNRQQSSVSSLSYSPSNSNISQKSTSFLSSSISSSALSNTLTAQSDEQPGQSSVPQLDQIKLEEQLNQNSNSILKLLNERQEIFSKINQTNSHIDSDSNDLKFSDMDAFLEHTQSILNKASMELNSLEMKILKNEQNKLDKEPINLNLVNLECYLKLLRSCFSDQQSKLKKDAEKFLPNLRLSLDECIVSKNSPTRPYRGQTLSVDSELVSSSVISSSSTNADLSEDEQINYYDEDTLDDLNGRSHSTGSDATLVIMPDNSVITECVKLRRIRIDNFPIYKETDENSLRSNGIKAEELNQEDEYKTPENEKEMDDSKLASFIMKKIRPNDFENDLDIDLRVPTPPTTEPPLLPNSVDFNNDLSDDEVKEYHFQRDIEHSYA